MFDFFFRERCLYSFGEREKGKREGFVDVREEYGCIRTMREEQRNKKSGIWCSRKK